MNQLKVQKQQSIQILRNQGWFYRKIAGELGIDRATVGRYLKKEDSKPAFFFADFSTLIQPIVSSEFGLFKAKARCEALPTELLKSNKWAITFSIGEFRIE